MKDAVDMGSGVMLYIPSFVNIGSGIQKLLGVIHRHTQKALRCHKPTFIFLLIRNAS
jgi:hypothetical protein